MPLGLDLKSLIVGMLLAYFVIPWIRGMMAGRTASAKATA